MSKRSIREYIREKSRVYTATPFRCVKTSILSEVVETTGLSRKHVMRRLNDPKLLDKKPALARRPRKKLYVASDFIEMLLRIWRESNYMCGKLLASFIPEALESFERDGQNLSTETRELLLKISPASIDRLLLRFKSEKPHYKRNRANAIKNDVPVSVLRGDRCYSPGHFGVDTVALGGGSASGEFFWILTLTDVYSGYTCIYPVWRKTAKNIVAALKKAIAEIPFKIKELHTDNGSEFLNEVVRDFVRGHMQGCVWRRSRAYHKNDNAHVEQKNRTCVRDVFGEVRFDKKELFEDLSRACELLNLRTNYFFPSRKLIQRERNPATGRVLKKYSAAETPCSRLLSSDRVDAATKQRLRETKGSWHLFKINRELNPLLNKIFHTQCGNAWKESALFEAHVPAENEASAERKISESEQPGAARPSGRSPEASPPTGFLPVFQTLAHEPTPPLADTPSRPFTKPIPNQP